jgi:hypothetical protein
VRLRVDIRPARNIRGGGRQLHTPCAADSHHRVCQRYAFQDSNVASRDLFGSPHRLALISNAAGVIPFVAIVSDRTFSIAIAMPTHTLAASRVAQHERNETAETNARNEPNPTRDRVERARARATSLSPASEPTAGHTDKHRLWGNESRIGIPTRARHAARSPANG